MPTTGLVNGTLIKLNVAGSDVTCETTSSLSVSRSFRETVCKDDAPYGSKLPGKTDWSVSVSGYVKMDGTYNHDEILTALLGGTEVAVVYGTGVTGDDEYTGSAYVSDCEITASTEETAEWSATLSGNGTLTAGVAV